MKRIISMIVLSMFIISAIGGCASTANTQNKTTTGAILGGIIGAAAGVILTGKLEGAAVGAAAGAAIGGAAGYYIGSYEDKQLKTKSEIYKQYPEYSKHSTALEPAIKDLTPELMDTNNNPIESLTAGQTIKMASEYTIVASPAVKNVEVEENNFIVMPDGTRTPDAIRTKPRDVQRVVGRQSITLPNELLPGKYTHVAIVKIGGKTEQSEQTIEVAAVDQGAKQYARNGDLK